MANLGPGLGSLLSNALTGATLQKPRTVDQDRRNNSPAAGRQRAVDPATQAVKDALCRLKIFDPEAAATVKAGAGRIAVIGMSDSEFAVEAAKRMGPNWRGDAFTAHVQYQGKKMHLIFVSDSSLKNGGKAMAVVQHELQHVKRFENGTFCKDDPKKEEREALRASIKAAGRTEVAIKREANHCTDQGRRVRLYQLAGELHAAAEADKRLLRAYGG